MEFDIEVLIFQIAAKHYDEHKDKIDSLCEKEKWHKKYLQYVKKNCKRLLELGLEPMSIELYVAYTAKKVTKEYRGY